MECQLTLDSQLQGEHRWRHKNPSNRWSLLDKQWPLSDRRTAKLWPCYRCTLRLPSQNMRLMMMRLMTTHCLMHQRTRKFGSVRPRR